MSENAREAILEAARLAAQHYGYSGINFRSIGETVGIKNASIYYHFPSKADLGAAVARRYWEDAASALAAIRSENPEPLQCLRAYPSIFRKSLEDGNRLCLSSFMAAEYQDLPEPVKEEILTFANINVAWLGALLAEIEPAGAEACERRARAIYTAIAGAQLIARTRADLGLYDELVQSYRDAGLIPA
ncbi:TetR/AcrR family transcriptional regulator [Pseudomonas marginalis]|uniref:TetR/AcrR family transcriptional regulator n=1 Tax=Pseudomonas marginalis TaxID=298 RepID=UPI0034D49702